MKTLRKVPVTVEHVKYMPDVGDMKQDVIYISDEFELAIHKCLCGCGNQSVTPMHPQKGWIITEKDGKVTFTPSILNTACPNRYHYIITNGIANVV